MPTSHLPNHCLGNNIIPLNAPTQHNIIYLSGHSWFVIPILVFVCAMVIPWYFERRAKLHRRLGRVVRIPLNTTNSTSGNDTTTTINDPPPEEVKPATASMPTANAVPIVVAEPTTAEEFSRGTTPLATAVSVTETNALL